MIQAEREARRGLSARTETFLSRHSAENLFITFTVAGELACGQSANLRRDWEQLYLPWTMEVSWQYGEIYRALSSAGKLIGGNVFGSLQQLWRTATVSLRRMKTSFGGFRD